MSAPQTPWTADRRVPALIARIERQGTTQKRWTDFSDSSAGMKEYFAHGGDCVAALEAIRKEYAAKIIANFTSAAWTAFCAQPTVEDIVRRLHGEWIDYRCEGREGYLSRADYVAACDLAIAAEQAEAA